MAFLSLLVGVALAARFEGKVDSKNGLAFLGKFVFDYSTTEPITGSYEIELSLANAPKDLHFILYDDEDGSFPDIYDKDVACSQAINTPPAKSAEPITMIQDHWTSSGVLGQARRPRYWFFVVASCTTPITGLQYTLHATNTLASTWNKELSVNDRGLNTLFLVMFFAFVILFAAHVFSTHKLRTKLSFLHPLVRLFLIVFTLEFVSIFGRMLHWCTLAGNGWGIPWLHKLSSVLDIFAKVGFILMLILLAKGWTISRDHIDGRAILIVVLVVYVICYASLMLWELAVQDPAETFVRGAQFWLLNSFLILWLGWAIYFLKNIIVSYRNEENPVKKALFRNLGMIYSFWFFGLPAAFFITFIASPWYRDLIVEIAHSLTTTWAMAFMIFLLWHSRAEEFFNVNKLDVSVVTARTVGHAYEQL